MANSKQLRANKAQHLPKNTQSKIDEKNMNEAMQRCIEYLEKRLSDQLKQEKYELVFERTISFDIMIKMIKDQNCRREFDTVFNNRTIIPDGGVIFLKKTNDPDYLRIVLISEIKRQGTNKQRAKEGKPKQSQGNAIERLGKNLTGIRAALNHEKVTPFVCFGSGCDFEKNYDNSDYVMSKISMLNEFYRLNRIYVFKADGSSDKNFFSPVSMFFREEEWSADEMFEILKEIGETSLRYYIF